MIEPRKEVVEAHAVRKAEGKIGRRETEGRLDRGHRAGHVCEGILETWEISSTPSQGGTAERRKRSEAEVGEKSECSVVAMRTGNQSRRDPKEPSEHQDVDPERGKSRRVFARCVPLNTSGLDSETGGEDTRRRSGCDKQRNHILKSRMR